MHNLPRKTVAVKTLVCSTGRVRWEVARNSRYGEEHKCFTYGGHEHAGLWNDSMHWFKKLPSGVE